MATQSAIHHMLAILAGDAPPDSLARLIGHLGWNGRFVRLSFPGIAPTDAFIVDVAVAAGLCVESLAPSSAPVSLHGGATEGKPCRWMLIGPQPPAEISSAVAHLRATHRIHAVPFRTVEDR